MKPALLGQESVKGLKFIIADEQHLPDMSSLRIKRSMVKVIKNLILLISLFFGFVWQLIKFSNFTCINICFGKRHLLDARICVFYLMSLTHGPMVVRDVTQTCAPLVLWIIPFEMKSILFVPKEDS